MVRSALSLILGLAATVVLVVLVNNFLVVGVMGVSVTAPTGSDMAAMAGAGVAAGMAGGAVTALLAPHHPIVHALALAAVIWALNFGSLWMSSAPGDPAWFWVFMSLLSGLTVLAGAYLVAPTRR